MREVVKVVVNKFLIDVLLIVLDVIKEFGGKLYTLIKNALTALGREVVVHPILGGLDFVGSIVNGVDPIWVGDNYDAVNYLYDPRRENEEIFIGFGGDGAELFFPFYLFKRKGSDNRYLWVYCDVSSIRYAKVADIINHKYAISMPRVNNIYYSRLLVDDKLEMFDLLNKLAQAYEIDPTDSFAYFTSNYPYDIYTGKVKNIPEYIDCRRLN